MSRSRLRLLPCVSCLYGLLVVAAAVPAGAQDPSVPLPGEVSMGASTNPSEITQAKEYADCMTLARRVPDQALESAQAWSKKGGGTPAGHCAAVALIGLGRFEEAALSLDKLAADELKARPDLAAGLYGQAAQAWVLDGDNERAIKAQTAAIQLAPGDVDLRIDRGVILASLGKYKEAIVDFSAAHDLAAMRADVLVYRATAYRLMKNLKLARADVDQAIKLQPKNADAFLERGIIRMMDNDAAGASQDWQHAVTFGPGTPAAETAEANLKQLDRQRPATQPAPAPTIPSTQPQ